MIFVRLFLDSSVVPAQCIESVANGLELLNVDRSEDFFLTINVKVFFFLNFHTY